MKAFFALLIMSFAVSAMAQDIFVIKKSKRVKNVLHFQANVANCKFKNPSITNHWIMGEENGQVEAINKSEKPYFSPKISYTNDTETIFSMGALEKLGNKLGDTNVRVRIVNCKAKAYMEIKGQEININEIFVNVNMVMMPQDITIKGIGPDGSKFSVTID